MNLWNSLAGMLEVELTSAQPEGALEAISAAGISIFRLEQIDALTFSFRMFRSDLRRLSALCQKRGEIYRVLRVNGLYWLGKRLLRRPVLLIGMAGILAMVLFLPTRVLFVQVEGNVAVPENRILDAAESCGIHFWASRREVRSEKMKNALLLAVPELQWAGVNTTGCVATISVREREEGRSPTEDYDVASIVASRDGRVLSGTVIRGTGLFQVGDVVKQGQVLISGYTDCGISIQATRAEGEILAQTSREITAVCPAQWFSRDVPQRTWKGYSLLLGKKRINLWKGSGIWDSSCDRIYREYYMVLPGGFQLPVALCVDAYTDWETKPFTFLEEETREELSTFAKEYLAMQMVAGKIEEAQERLVLDQERWKFSGSYVCQEMIGRVRQEQIGEGNGKDS